MVSYRYITLLALMGLAGCKQDEANLLRQDAQGIITQMPRLWSSGAISKGGQVGTGVRAGIVYENVLVVGGGEPGSKPIVGNQVLLGLDTETGKELWRWNDKLTTFEGIDVKYLYQHYLLVQGGPRNYCLDVRTGQTVWKKNIGTDIGSVVSGLGNTYLIGGVSQVPQPEGFEVDVLYEGYVLSGQPERIVAIPPYTRKFTTLAGGGTSAGIISGEQLTVYQGDTLVAFDYWEPDVPNSQIPANYLRFLGLYNLTKRSWIYDRKPIASAGGWVRSVIGNQVYCAGVNLITCYDLWTGELRWQQKPEVRNPGIGVDLLVAGGKVLVSFGDLALAYDPLTGRQLWSAPITNLFSRIHYQDGVMYAVGGGDGILYAIDTQTGNYLWKLRPKPNENFDDYVAGVPGKNGQKGRIFAQDGHNVYCYEAAK